MRKAAWPYEGAICQFSIRSRKHRKIIADIADLLREGGSDVRILYGAGADSSDADARKISGRLEYYAHNALSRLTDHAGLYSRTATKKLIHEVKSFRPDLIHLHTLHGFYMNYEMLFRFLKGSGIPVVWTLHDCWSFTGHCTHFSQIKCTQWQTECQSCQLLRRYPHCYGKGDVRRNFLRKKDAFTGVKNLVITTPSQWLARTSFPVVFAKLPQDCHSKRNRSNNFPASGQ